MHTIVTLLVGWTLTAACMGKAGAERRLPEEGCEAPARAWICDGIASGRYLDEVCDAWRDSQHFRVHYATEGEHALVGWPSTAYVDSASIFLEEAHEAFLRLGFPAPPLDGAQGGGANLYDCYIIDCHSRGGDGFAGTDSLTHVPCDGSWTGIFGVDHDLESLCSAHLLPAVLAHEYFLSPFRGLWTDTAGTRMYGAAHFWCCLEETLGETFMPAILNRCCTSHWKDALRDELAQRGTSLDSALVRFALWNNATDDWHDGSHYRQGWAYPEVRCQAVHDLLPIDGEQVSEELLAGSAAFNYVRFSGPGVRDSLRIAFDGAPDLAGTRFVSVARQRRGEPQQEWIRTPDQDGDVVFEIPGWSSCDRVTLIVVNSEQAEGDFAFRYSAEEFGEPAPLWMGELALAPSPFGGETRVTWRMEGSPLPVVLSIFDLEGRCRLVRRFAAAAPGDQAFVWEGRDDRGAGVPAGLYFFRLEGAGQVRQTRAFKLTGGR